MSNELPRLRNNAPWNLIKDVHSREVYNALLHRFHVELSHTLQLGSAMCLTRNRGVAGLSLAGVTALCPCLELVEPRKTRPDITEKLSTGTYKIKSSKTIASRSFFKHVVNAIWKIFVICICCSVTQLKYMAMHVRRSHYAITHVCNTNNNIQERSQNVVKVIFHTIRNCSLRKEFAPSGSKFFLLREVPIMKMDAIEENYCSIQ